MAPIRTASRLLLVIALLLGVVVVAAAREASAARPIPPPLHVLITASGFVPPNVSVAVGQTVVFENRTATNRSVAAADGLFASGPIPPAGAFVLAVAQAGAHNFDDGAGAGGTLAVGALGLEGPDNALAQSFIPGPPHPLDGDALGFHPTLGFSAARNRLLVGIAPGATVAAVNNALATAGVTIAGGFERWDLLAVETPDPGTDAGWTLLDAAVAALEASSAIAVVSYDLNLKPESTIPRPTSPMPGANWTWDDVRYGPTSENPGAPKGADANQWLEAARFPHAWNVNDAITKTNADVDTVVIDSGFDLTHPDLQGIPFPSLCITDQNGQPVCSRTDQTDADKRHGTIVASALGATYDRTGRAPSVSVGTTGANPFADLTLLRTKASVPGIEYNNPDELPQSTFLVLLDIVARNRNEHFPSLRVINLSFAQIFYGEDLPAKWAETRAGKLCGPGTDDDDSGTLPCVPQNDDQNLTWIRQAGESLRNVFKEFSQAGILFVKSAGNDSGSRSLCATGSGPTCQHVMIPSAALDPMAWLAKNWTGDPTPLLVVEAWEHLFNPAGPRRADYSNTGGDISAAGFVWTPTFKAGQTASYEQSNGTSVAAPQVSALAGLLWKLSPGLSLGQVRSLILDNARHDVIAIDPEGQDDGPAAPRIDAYATLMASLGGANAMVDVNDGTADGNQRLQWAGNSSTPVTARGPSGSFSVTDGSVDMRDFRAFRDAWLDTCLKNAGRPGCPAAAQIDLDGALDHPKRDLNRDGCIGFVKVTNPTETVGCATEETFARFDFNADGQISPTTQATVPITAAGAPASMTTGTSLSDLGVMQAKWTGGDGANVPATALPGLMLSADLAIDIDDVKAVAEGAISTFVLSGPAGIATPPNSPVSGPHVVTAPVDVSDLDPAGGRSNVLQTWAVTTVNGQTQAFVGGRKSGVFGADLRDTICPDTLVATASASSLPVGSNKRATLSYSSRDCGLARDNVPMRYEIVGDAHGATLVNPVGATNLSGDASVQLKAGTSSGIVKVRAFAAIGLGGREVSRDLDIAIGDGFAVHYLWRETVLDWNADATSQWGPGKDDCDQNPGPAESAKLCFATHAWLRPDSGFFGANGVPTYQNRRRGVIKVDAAGDTVVDEDINAVMLVGGTTERGWQLSEHVDQWAANTAPHFDPLACDSYQSGQCPVNVVNYSYSRPGLGLTPDQWAINFRDKAIPGVSVDTKPEGLVLGGLRNIADEPIPVTQSPTFSTHDDSPLQAPNYPTEILLAPRGNGSNFQYAKVLGGDVSFVKTGNTYAPYNYCGVVEQDLQVDEGYWSSTDADLADGIRNRATRRLARAAGDRAAPIYQGVARSRIEFVAVVAPADANPTLTFPTCNQTQPDATFSVTPTPVTEGTTANFGAVDPAAGPDATFTWSFGDGSPTASGKFVAHTFPQSGTFPVKLTIAEPGEATRTAERNVVVENVAPTMSVTSLEYDGTDWKLALDVDDASAWDAATLKVELSAESIPQYLYSTYVSPTTGPFTINPLPPGAYTLTIKVTDPDGASVTKTLEVSVAEIADDAAGAGAFGGAGVSAATARGVASTSDVSASAVVGSVSAYVVDALTATTAQGLTVRNASMANGVPVAATLTPGDGRDPTPLAPGATTTVGYLDAGVALLSVAATGASTAATADIEITGPSRPPVVAYTGATSGAVGLPANVRATVTTAGGVVLGGRTVRFTLNGTTVEANSNAAGVAQTTLPVPGPSGPATIQVEAIAAGGPGASTSSPFTVTANAIPTALAQGPYNLVLNTDLALSGNGTDSDAGEQATLQYAWDLDADGAFDDATGKTPTIPWNTARTVICAGTCEPGASFPATLRVTDAKGAVDTDSTSIVVARDFAIAMTPNVAALVPNAATSFRVVALTNSDWAFPITLAAPGLPSGVTATFNPATISPGGSSLLTLKAGATIPQGNFGVTVTGTSNGVVRQAGGSLTLDFGLIPVCRGSVSGRILDRDTMLPLAGVSVALQSSGLAVTTGADGTYSFPQVQVAADNSPRSWTMLIQKAGYLAIAPPPTVVASCGAPTVVGDTSILLQRFATVRGVLRGHTRAGAPLGPINGTTQNGSVTLGTNKKVNADGTFEFTNVALGPDNSPTDTNATGFATGFYTKSSSSIPVSAGAVTDNVVIDLEQQCTATIRARVVFKDTGLPITGARVTAVQGTSTTTDANGFADVSYTLPQSNFGNSATLSAQTPAGMPSASAGVNIGVPGCGATGFVTIPLDVHFPVPNYGRFEITVVDKDTGAPIEGAGIFGSGLLTNADGKLAWDAFLGDDSEDARQFTIQASKTGYWNSVGQIVVLHKDETLAIRVEMVKTKFVVVEGTVTDRLTGEPLAGARASIASVGQAFTDANGRYRIENVPLNSQNTARDHLLNVTADGYWNSTGIFGVSPTEPVKTVDRSLVQVCRGATVRGRVVNAETGAPIFQARVSAGNFGTDTDAEGRFVLDPLPPGTDNEPWNVTVTASKSGFVTANKQITLFCGADVLVDFGRAEAAFGAVSGTVTNEEGDPVAGVFVGSGFGGSDTTDADGNYAIANAPLGDDGEDRTWDITALPEIGSGYGEATKPGTVKANTTTDIDFVLGAVAPPTSTTTTSTSSTTSTSTSSTTSPSTTSTSTTTSTTTTTVPPPTTTTTSTTTTSTSTTTTTATSTTSTSTTTTVAQSTTTTTVGTQSTTSTTVDEQSTTTSSPSTTVPSDTTTTPVTNLGTTSTTSATAGSGSTEPPPTTGSSGGSSLPRTGAGLALLFLGALLIFLGAPLTRRRATRR